MKCKLCGTITRESSSEKYIIDFWNQRFTDKPKTYRQYFEENFPKDKFPNADYEGMCREVNNPDLRGWSIHRQILMK